MRIPRRIVGIVLLGWSLVYGEEITTEFVVTGCASTATGTTSRSRSSHREVAPQIETGHNSLRYTRAGRHQCCLQVELGKQIATNAVALTEIWTGAGCRCVCSSVISAVISNIPAGTYTVTVDTIRLKPETNAPVDVIQLHREVVKVE